MVNTNAVSVKNVITKRKVKFLKDFRKPNLSTLTP